MSSRRGRKRLEEKHPEILEELGKVPDKVLADLYGVHRTTIMYCRRRNSIAAPETTLAGDSRSKGVAWMTRSEAQALNDDRDKVVVAFRMQTDGTVSLLNSFQGIRVFDKGHVDPRVAMAGPLPHFRTWGECEAYLKEEPGKHRPCLLSYSVAKRTFSGTYADYTPSVSYAGAAERKIREAADAGKGVRLSAEEVQSLAEGM